MSIASGSEIFRCRDRWRREIVLLAVTWQLHILPDRAPLLGNEASVRLTLTEPHLVMHDATHGDREGFHRLGALPPPYDHLYLKVCVEFGRIAESTGGWSLHFQRVRLSRLNGGGGRE